MNEVKSEKTPRAPLVAVGVISKVFGLKGEVKVHSYSRSAEEIEQLREVLVGRSDSSTVKMKVERLSPRGNDVYLKFAGIDDRTASESLIGHFLFVEEADRKHLADGEFFIDDIIGMSVVDLRKNRLGIIANVVTLPAQDMYVVNTGRSEIMVPAVKSIVRSVDMKSRTMTIDPPEGLFNGNEAAEETE